MKEASVRDLHLRTSELVREASEGSTMTHWPDMTRVWETFPQVPGDSGRFLEEDR